MASFLRPFEGIIYSGFRLVFGLLFIQHGAQKLFGFFGGPPPLPAPVLYTGGLIELVGGALVAVGLMTSWAAFFCSGMMAVAYFTVHLPNGFWPIQNNGEMSALYSWAFLFIAAHGSGKLSLDKALDRA